MEIDAVRKRISLIEKHKKEISDAKEILKEELENDPAYMEALGEFDAANAKKKRIKEEILSRGANSKLAMEVKTNAEELALLKEILSAELMQILKEEDTDEIADENGDSRKLKAVVSLLPKGAKLQGRDGLGKYNGESEKE